MLKLTIFAPLGGKQMHEAGMVLLPTINGQIGVLKGHIALIATLQFGLIVLRDSKGLVLSSFYVDGGEVEVKDDHIKVLCNDFVDAKKCDKAFLEKQISSYPKKVSFYQSILNIVAKDAA